MVVYKKERHGIKKQVKQKMLSVSNKAKIINYIQL